MVRELERDDRIVSFRLTIPTGRACSARSRRGSAELGANILEVDHRRLFLDVPAKGAQARRHGGDPRRAHAEEILRALAADGYQPVRIETATTME